MCKSFCVTFSYVQTDITTPNIVGPTCCVRLHLATGFKLCATNPGQTDEACNIQQCRELLANDVVSVFTGGLLTQVYVCRFRLRIVKNWNWLSLSNKKSKDWRILRLRANGPNNVDQQLPTLLAQHVASVWTPCCILLDVVACCCAKFETSQTFHLTPNLSFVPWFAKRSATMLDPFA